jgi:glutathione S-transferase
MHEFVIHTVPGSPYARAVMMALEEKGAPYRVAGIAPRELRGPAHLARQPFGKMPAFEHGDFALYETQAILRYIDRVLPVPALSPGELQALAQMDQLMNISDHYLFRGVGDTIGFQRVVGPAVMGLTPDEAVIAAAMPDGHRVFGVLAGLLGEMPFLTGDALSLADVMVAAQLDMFSGTPEWAVLAGPHPRLAAWFARMRARPGMLATTWEKVSEKAKAAK